MSSPSAKLEKTINRFKARIDAGSYYEAQQTIRTIVNRYIRAKDHDAASELLYHSSLIFSENGRFDEGTDLLNYLLEVYLLQEDDLSNYKETQLPRIIQILASYPDDNSNIPTLGEKLTSFANKKTGSTLGDSKINLIIGEKLYYSGNPDSVSNSEKYLLLTDSDKANELLVDLCLQEYLDQENNSYNLHEYLERLVIPYLKINNIKLAKHTIEEFFTKRVSSLKDDYENFQTVTFEGDTFFLYDVSLSDDSGLTSSKRIINYLQLLIALIQRNHPSNAQNFKLLFGRYKQDISQADITTKINELGQAVFNVSVVANNGNFLQDMMSGLLGGGPK
ncbi:BA75_00295T0 [Komagataella pastoris]|uniref:BA75_00295T0 n=1 Tax=Komagataella pastoris TaxID=4922 RepID=A0A1B2J5C4_PICPA|nr:BA75_00295T0 [Komagataella pastoris]